MAVWLLSDAYGKENLTTAVKLHLHVCASPFYVCRRVTSASLSVLIHVSRPMTFS